MPHTTADTTVMTALVVQMPQCCCTCVPGLMLPAWRWQFTPARLCIGKRARSLSAGTPSLERGLVLPRSMAGFYGMIGA